MVTIFLVTSLILFGLMGSFSFAANITADLYRHCPTNTFAYRQGNGFIENDTHVSCCAHCVVENCGLRAPCCPDYKLVRMTSVCMSIVHTDNYDFMFHSDYERRYWMVKTCLPDYSGSSLEQACMNTQFSRNLSTLQPVLDNSTNVIYANQFCALCNGVSQSIDRDVFLPRVRCMIDSHTLSVLKTIDKLDEFLDTGECFYQFWPRSLDSVYVSECRPYQLSACNITGNWKVFDQTLVDACESYEMMYTGKSLQTFKNIHCQLCNTDEESDIRGSCRDTGLHFGFIKAFSAILGEGGSAGQYQPMSRDGPCLETQIYDSQQGSCRDFVCAGTKVMTGGVCIPALTSLQEVVWSLNIFWIVQTESSGERNISIDSLVEYALVHLNNSFYFKYKEAVSLLDTKVYVDDSQKDIWVLTTTAFLYTKPTDVDPGIELLGDFRDSLRQTKVHVVDGTRVEVKEIAVNEDNLQFNFREITIFGQNMVKMYEYKIQQRHEYGVTRYSVSKTGSCDQVLLQDDEYSISLLDVLSIRRNGLLLSNVEYLTDYQRQGVLVCVEDFLYQEQRSLASLKSRGASAVSFTGHVKTLTSLFYIGLVLLSWILFQFLRTTPFQMGICLAILATQCLCQLTFVQTEAKNRV